MADEEKQLDDLKGALIAVPTDMICFSAGLRQLFNEFKVTGNDDATRKFVEIRDKTRQQAMVYTKQVLPVSEMAIKAISSYMDCYKDLDFNDWAESLEDILEELKEAQGVCELLRLMHINIIVEMKKNSDAALVGVKQLENLQRDYEQQKQKLLNEADQRAKAARTSRTVGAIFGVFTLGIGAAVGEAVAVGQDREASAKLAQSVAKAENANIAGQAARLTTGILIPAIKSFVNGLDVCLVFINRTRVKVEKMIDIGEKGPKQMHYKRMKGRAVEIGETCEYFLSVTDQMRTNLQAIPEKSDDKNYVDKWLEAQMQQFKKEQGNSMFSRVIQGPIWKKKAIAAR